MLFEHWIYSLAVAMIAGILYHRFTGRDLWWIAVGCAYAPDFDMCADAMLKKLGVTVLIQGSPIKHGDFHNMAAMILFAAGAAMVLHPFGIKLTDSLFFSGMGFGAHLLEDALVAAPAYSFLWPLSAQRFGIGMFSYSTDFYGIGDREVLLAGVVFLELSFIMRTIYEGRGWIGRSIRSVSSAFRPLPSLPWTSVSYLYEERENS